jgi:COP9 signalosome complex subunit 4
MVFSWFLMMVYGVMNRCVEPLRERGEDFSDALMEATDLLAQIYQAEDMWKKAAYALTGFKFEKYRQCTATPERRVDWQVNAAELWLECEEAGSASQAIKKAHAMIQGVKENAKLVLRFKTCYARVLDAERKFLEAAVHYKQLSTFGGASISEGDMLKTLEFAVTCAILAKAGPNRSRVLAMLYSDERSQHLHNYALLNKVTPLPRVSFIFLCTQFVFCKSATVVRHRLTPHCLSSAVCRLHHHLVC